MNTDKPTTTASAPETREGHAWNEQGFCPYCDNVHQSDNNARSTCSDGFRCEASAPETRIDAAELAYREANPQWQYYDVYSPGIRREWMKANTRTIPAEKPTDVQRLIEHDQAETTRAINLRQHLDGALAEIQHLRRKIYTLTDERAKFARQAVHADKLAEALRDMCEGEFPDFAAATRALDAYEESR